MKAELALLVDDIVDQFKIFPTESLKRMEEALASPIKPQTVQMTLFFRILNLEKLTQTFEAVRQHYQGK